MAVEHERTRAYLGQQAHDRVRSATIALIGVGAVGHEVAKSLALAGVGRLLLVDPDRVSPTCLDRCILFGPGDVGRPKVEVVAERLRARGATSHIGVEVAPIEALPDLDLATLTALAVAVDRDTARLATNLHALAGEQAPWLVEGALGRDFVEYQVLRPGAGACLVCNWTLEQLERINRQRIEQDCAGFFATTRSGFPAIVTLSSLLAAQMAAELLAIAAGTSAPPGRVVRTGIDPAATRVAHIARNPACVEPLCRLRAEEAMAVGR